MIAGSIAALLVIAFWPRIDASSASLKASVEQPVFVAHTAPEPEKSAGVGRTLGREALAKLANALRGAKANETPIVSLAFPIDEARRLCAEGLIAFANGDIASARALLRRAAEGGDARALMALGDTYDPLTLSRLGALGLKGDEATARGFYSRALAAGVGGARERIASLAAR